MARPDPGYRIAQTVPIAGGFLQILEDARLKPALARKLWETAVDPVLVLGEDAPEAQTFKTAPLRPARFRQVARDGSAVLDIVPNEQAPIAKIEARRLAAPADPIYLVTTDDSAGFGSYSGLATTLYALRAGRIGPVLATGQDRQAKAIVLVDTLKSGWRIIDPNPVHTVIEQVFCRPDFDAGKPGAAPKFQLTYITYWSDGRSWRMAKRVTAGFWENEGNWPAASNFPKAGDR